MQHQTAQAIVLASLLGSSSMVTSPLVAADNKHYPGIFVGALNSSGETELSLGLEYEYRFTPQWGAGLIYEKASDAHHGDGVSATIAALYYHPYAGWRLGAGIGREKVHGAHSHTEDLYRLNLAYDFHFGEFGVAPTFSIDRVDGHHSRVYGISISKAF
ncbi:hypothetical protein [Bowmanella pacifica]|uniref:Outer membrane protein beta-barrel domain-containing protein n=1 Tax=Bowmanella pacifica TaxID=502051 RepID=A0A917Z4V4_9ALTE|nr:hypothetical protein [Bowmanella pacifica]GGO73120.1 hypothetical protein GCM10010982_32910 [Bowmanella pacifica]